MDIYNHHLNAADLVAKRLTHKFWAARVSDMLRHVCLMRSRDNSTAMPIHKVRIDRVAKDWPRCGSITVTRDDGKRFALRMVADQFKVEAI